MTETNEWITRQETARLMGVHPRTVDYQAAKGRITQYRDGLGRLRYHRPEIIKLLTPVAVVSSDR